MRHLAVVLAALTALTAATHSADARERRHKRDYDERGYTTRYYRPRTVAPNGACQRDNGVPLGSLNLNRQCDREEFWSRIDERSRR